MAFKSKDEIVPSPYYAELLDEYHKEYRDVAELKRLISNFNAKTQLLGLGAAEFIIFDNAVFMTKAPPKIEFLSVPEFVFGFASIKSIDYVLMHGNREYVFMNMTQDLHVKFNRPLVCIQLKIDTDKNNGYYFEYPDDNAAGNLFRYYAGSKLIVEDMVFGSAEGYGMFFCPHLREIEFRGKTDTSRMIYADCMFMDTSLNELVLPNGFDTSSTKSMSRMFKGSTFGVLDLSQCNFDTRNVDDFREMFKGCAWVDKFIVGSQFKVHKDKEYAEEAFEEMFDTCTGLFNSYKELKEAGFIGRCYILH